MSAREFIERVDLGDELRAHAAISSRPGQLAELEALADRADRITAALRAVLDLADRWEHGATRWADPLPVPLEVEQVRRAITDALGGEGA